MRGQALDRIATLGSALGAPGLKRGIVNLLSFLTSAAGWSLSSSMGGGDEPAGLLRIEDIK